MSGLDKLNALIAESPELLAENSKYTPKLTFAERCAALALTKHGILRQTVCIAFGINPSTLNHITRPSSLHYRAVRRELADLGLERFKEKYITEDIAARIHEAEKSVQSTMTQEQRDAERYEAATTPDKRAKVMQGKHTVLYSEGTLYCYVEWTTPPFDDPYPSYYPDPRPLGWYVRVDPASPGWSDMLGVEWHGLAADSFTSKKAWVAFKSNIDAKEDHEQ